MKSQRREYQQLKEFFVENNIFPAVDPSCAQTLLVLKESIEKDLDKAVGETKKILKNYVNAIGIVARAGVMHHNMVSKENDKKES